ncbi:hypothetical protein CBFG_00141 [Clostridiales bacterium 1_7_47FAA]|nr:hypothetical protein CBFG_00141 [Clostridiales bacterium 1_7_47FAA]
MKPVYQFINKRNLLLKAMCHLAFQQVSLIALLFLWHQQDILRMIIVTP